MPNKGVIYIGDVSGNLASLTTSGEIKIAGTISASASISGQPVSISGQTVVANVTTNISGQTVYLPNDGVNDIVWISGQLVIVSGNVRTLSGSTTNISGNHVSVSGIVTVNSLPVISISGNAIQISGQTVTVANAVSTGVSGQTIYLVNDSVNNITKISGQLVAVSGSVAVNSLPVISISGNAVRTSGQTTYLVNDGVNNVVSISGQTVVASVVTNISGQVVATSGTTVYLVDGKNTVLVSGQQVVISDSNLNSPDVITDTQIDDLQNDKNALVVGGMNYGYDNSQNKWARLRVTNSGDGFKLAVSISGQPVTGTFNVASNVSGNTIYLVDNGVNNVVKISGQTVVAQVSLGTTPTSGDASRISGQTIYLVNDSINNVSKISGQLVVVSGVVTINPIPPLVSGDAIRVSGQTIYLVDNGVNNVVKISGQTVVASVSLGTTPTSGDASRISGQTIYIIDDSVNNRVKISGQTVTVSGNVVNVSGATISVSGIVNIGNTPTVLVSGGVHVSGDTVSVSGIVRLAIPTAIRTRALLACTALSGGTQLLSGDVRKATVINAGSAGTVMYIGSTTDPPYSGQGLYLLAGNGLTIETNNFNNIRAFAATSGIRISYIGEQY